MLELSQHAIDGGQSDVVLVFENLTINILSSHMLTARSFEYFEDTHARMRNLQSGSAQVLGFHAGPPHSKVQRKRLLGPCNQISVGRPPPAAHSHVVVSRDPGRSQC